MLWRRSVAPPFSPSTVAVPDAEALRRAALQASWQRGRWVARRRVAVRWLLWIATRYLMPTALVLGLGAWLWLGVLGGKVDTWPPLARWADRFTPVPAASTAHTASVPPVASPPVPAPPANPAATPAAAPPASTAEIEFSPEGELLISPLRLRLDPGFNASAQPAQTMSVPAADPTPSSTFDNAFDATPPLKPENWLHSKEP